jgi:hypothetical protein
MAVNQIAGPADGSEDTNAAAAPVEIKIKWPIGKKYSVQMENIQSWESAGEAGPSQKPSRVTMGLTHIYTISVVRELAGGGAELELEFSSQKMFYQMGEIPVLNFDSAQPVSQDGGSPVAPVLRKMVGAQVRCFTDENGRAAKFEGFKELNARMAGAQPQVRAMLQAMFNETNLKQIFDFAAALQPQGSVLVGDTWPVHLEMPDPVGLMVLDMNCVLKGWESQDGHRCVRLEYEGNTTSQPAENGRPSPTKIEEGRISGKAWFDPKLGRVINSATEQHMTLQTAAMGKAITTHFNLSLNFRFLREMD